MRILRAQAINRALGGAVVTPWDVEELPDSEVDAVLAVAAELPEIRRGAERVAEAFRAFRQRHPQYGKYRH